MRTNEYVEAALKQAQYETLGDGTVYGHVPGLAGVWSNASTRGEAEAELADVLEEWIYLRLSKGLPIPAVAGVDIKAPTLA